MKPNKKLFHDVSEAVAALCAPEGFVEHPLYPTGWEATNQAYQHSLIPSDLSTHIDQLEMSFMPVDRAFRFVVTRSDNVFGFKDLADLPTDPRHWTDMWLHQPFTEYQLVGGPRWALLAMGRPFQLRPRDLQDTDSAAAKIIAAFRGNARYLFDALRGHPQGRRVAVSAYDVKA